MLNFMALDGKLKWVGRSFLFSVLAINLIQNRANLFFCCLELQYGIFGGNCWTSSYLFGAKRSI